MLGKKVLIVVMTVFSFSSVFAEPVEEFVPTIPPTWELRPEIGVEVGICADPVYEGMIFVKYQERPNKPGQFTAEKATFFNAWVIFDGAVIGKKVAISRFLLLTLQFWTYDPETMTKTCSHWEIAGSGIIGFRKFIEDKDNAILDRGETIYLTPEEAVKFAPLVQKIVKELLEKRRKTVKLTQISIIPKICSTCNSKKPQAKRLRFFTIRCRCPSFKNMKND